MGSILPVERQNNPTDRSREMGRNAYSSEPHGRLAIGKAGLTTGFSGDDGPYMGGMVAPAVLFDPPEMLIQAEQRANFIGQETDHLATTYSEDAWKAG